MKIEKNKKQFNSFDIKGLTSGKLLAIHKVLEDAKKNGTLGVVGQEVLNTFDQERKNFING